MYSGSDRPSAIAEQVDRQFCPAGVEGHQVLAVVGPFGDHDGGVPHPGHPQQGVVDLADLDPETADLDLAVAATEELQLPVGQPSTVVPGLVEPIIRAVRVRP